MLQWTRLFETFAQNFVQYRRVANLTQSTTSNDLSTPYTTLSMSFMSATAQQFIVPASTLAAGVFYEFRLGFPFPSYTYYTNTLIAKTFDATSPFVNSLSVNPTDVFATASWHEPEYNSGLVGYRVALFYKQIGNGAISNPQWASDPQLTSVVSLTLPLTQTSVDFGCSDRASASCLPVFTTYLLQISVVRQSGTDSPRSFYFATKPAAIVARNTSSMFLYGGKITVHLTVDVPMYNNTPIASTLLYPVGLSNKRGDLNLTSLTQSTVQTESKSSLVIFLSNAEYSSLLNQLRLSSFLYSAMSLTFGARQEKISIQPYCLIDFIIKRLFLYLLKLSSINRS